MWRAWLRRAVGVALVVAGSVAVAVVVIVQSVVLDAGTYRSALAATDAYDRIYTEVLADPELAAVTEDLLGELGLPPELRGQARIMAANVLRWAAPPSTVRVATEAVIGGALAYVRGDVPRLRADLVVTGIAERLPATIELEVRTLLASAAEQTVASVGELEQVLSRLGDELAAGVVPAAIPVVGGATFDPLDVADAIVAALGERADAATREVIVGAVLAGDQRDAVIAAAATAVAEHGAALAARLRATSSIDLVAVVAEHGERPVGSVVGAFDDARALARWFGPWTALVGVLVTIAGGALLAWGRPWREAIAWLGGSVVAAGALLAAGWVLAARVVDSPFEAATSGGTAWNLPHAAHVLLADVGDHVTGHADAMVWRVAAVLVVAGAVLVAGSLLGRVTFAVPERRTVVVGAALVAGALVVGAIVSTVPEPVRACNGDPALCDEPYDEVTFAATHNAMSAPDVVQFWPEHDGGITEQLDAGVRALLIDTKHWEPLPSVDALVALAEDERLPLPRPLAESLYERLRGLRDGRPGAFLCHIHCGFGAQPLVEGLSEVRRFLERNPDDVVTLIIQDEIPTDETVAAFEEAGLLPYVHEHHADDPWPTLGSLIARDERLVVFAENEGPPPAWYANAFEAMQETPFLFLTPEAFSCEENRGRRDATLFQLNHWVQRIAPDRVDATVVNQLDVLVDRARRCAAERGLQANFLAVNFYNIGDVVRAAAVLNGLE